MMLSSVLDPVQHSLDPSVWDNADDIAPSLKSSHAAWIMRTVWQTLEDNGYKNPEAWGSLYLTGSLTTYQYSPESDCDVSLFVDAKVFPEWSRAELIGILVSNVDVCKLPGTTHPMQCYVVPQGLQPQDLYKPGERSGWDILEHRWIVPPERDRVHDVHQEYAGFYQWAQEQADKMERLMEYEPDKAHLFYEQIHHRRQRDMQMGKGDYSESNILYKFLDKRGLIPQGAGHVAKTAALERFDVDHDAVQRAAQHLGLNMPVNVQLVQGTSGSYDGFRDGAHRINLVSWLRPERASQQIWHEMTHAKQLERDPDDWHHGLRQYLDTYAQGHEAYRAHPWEVEARQVADSHPFMLTREIPTEVPNGSTPTRAGAPS